MIIRHIKILFNKELLEFLEHEPQFGTSGSSGTQYLSVSEGLGEDIKLLKELVDGTLNLRLPKYNWWGYLENFIKRKKILWILLI